MQRCKIPKRQLNNSRYDFRKNQRTAEGVAAKIEHAKAGLTATERKERQKRHGVVIPNLPNPLSKITFDKQLQAPFDILHQDALVSTVCSIFNRT